MKLPRFLFLLSLAGLLTLLNALKPLHIDDPAYYFYAAHIAEHPLDPYGFRIPWPDEAVPANHVLAPPVLPYWWAAGIRLLGDRPLLWKFWLLPVSLLLVISLHHLLHRWARGLELPLLALIVLSPTLLPSFNFMLDVPALVLGLAALVVFIGAVECASWQRAVLAGLIAGIGMQTKYTALLTPCVLLLYAGVYRRPRLGILAASVAGMLFLCWETIIALRYGESHFLYHLGNAPEGWKRLHLLTPLVGILGGAAPVLGLLALAALRTSHRIILGIALSVGVGYLLLACVPEAWAVLLRDAGGRARLSLNMLIVGPAGLLVCGAVAAAAARFRPLRTPWRRVDRFLILWLSLELAGYFALTPYAATRRVLGLVVVATLVVGRLAALSCRAVPRRRLVHILAALNISLALVFFEVDRREAAAEQWASESAAGWIRQRDPEAAIWFTGHWGFQFYAQRAGMVPLMADTPRPRCGDWLVLPDKRVAQQAVALDWDHLQARARLRLHDDLGLRTLACYYCGNTALEHHEGARISVTIYRWR